MEMTWMAERRLEARAALTEVHLACEPRPHHPLQRAIHSGAADAWILAADEIAQIVGAQVAFLAHEDRENPIAFAGPLATSGPQARQVGKGTGHHWNWRAGKPAHQFTS